MRIIWFSKIQN